MRAVVVEFDYLSRKSTQRPTGEGPDIVIEELAIATAESALSLQACVFEQPYPIDQLPGAIKRQNAWVVRNHYGIVWSAGYFPHFKLPACVISAASHADVIFSKGDGKCGFLSDYTETPVYDLETFEFPRAVNVDTAELIIC